MEFTRAWMLAVVATCLVSAIGAASGTPSTVLSTAPLSRDEQPILIRGGLLSAIDGENLDRIRVYRYDGNGGFEPLPFQIDERIEKTFNPGTPFEFVESIYDVFEEDDGFLDDDDELALLFADAGVRAPSDTAWPPGSDPVRYEVEIRDPRADAPVPNRWVYLFLGDTLPRAQMSYVDWGGLPSQPVNADGMQLTWDDRWLLTELRVAPPCGTGEDLIDRVKGRAITFGELREDEEGWNRASTYMGGIAGPVRAIRYVRGATSGVNTIHHDVVYRRWWKRTVNLRVHPLVEARIYFDLRPVVGSRLYTSTAPDGVDVDGDPDTMLETAPTWTVLTGPAGGFVTAFDVPESPLYETKFFHYVDDDRHDDDIGVSPVYEDEDDAAFGAHGVGVRSLGDSNVVPIEIHSVVYTICAGEGDGGLGQSFRAMTDSSVQLIVTPQGQELSPVRDLAIDENGLDVLLDWPDVTGAASYRVYRSQDPALSHAAWIAIGHTTVSEFTDPGAVMPRVPRYYSVAPIDGNGEEGDW